MAGNKYFTGYRSAHTWYQLGLIGDALHFTDDEVTTKVGIGYTRTQVNDRTAMEAALQFTLLSAGPTAELSREQMLNDHTRLAYYIEEGIVHDGWLTNDNGGKERRWVYRSDMEPRHYNRIAAGWDYDSAQVSGTGKWWAKNDDPTVRNWSDRKYEYVMARYVWKSGAYDGAEVLSYSTNKRDLIHLAEDKQVLKCISRVLTRLIQGERVIKIGEGRGRRFKWDNWGWVDEIRQNKTVSNSKARKLGDVVNGWEYVIKGTRDVYGVKIHTYQWVPVNRESLKYYGVHANMSSKYEWSHHRWQNYTYDFLYFYDRGEAQRMIDAHNGVCDTIEQMIEELSKASQVIGLPDKIHLHANGTVTEPKAVKNNVVANVKRMELFEGDFELTLPQHASVEDMPSPEEIVERMQLQRTDMLEQYMQSIEMKGYIPVKRIFTEGER